MPRSILAAAFALGLTAGACFRPPSADVLFSCDPVEAPACPPGYTCQDDGCCHKDGTDPDENRGACMLPGTGGAGTGTAGSGTATSATAGSGSSGTTATSTGPGSTGSGTGTSSSSTNTTGASSTSDTGTGGGSDTGTSG